MSLTKKDKEEIKKLILETIGEVNDLHDCLDYGSKEILRQLDKRWRENGIKSETTGLIIAPEDVEIDGKTEFTWDEAMALEKEGKIPEGWRLPTRHEWVLIAEEFGQDSNGELDKNILSEALNLNYNTLSSGYYWSASPYTSDSSYAYYLGFNSSSVNPQCTSYKYDGFSVRCVSL